VAVIIEWQFSVEVPREHFQCIYFSNQIRSNSFISKIEIRKLTALKSKSDLNPNPIAVIKLYIIQLKDSRTRK